MPSLNRRSLLFALMLAANFAAGTAMAKDGDSGGGSGSSGSGSGSGGSGSGGGEDDGDDDDDDDGETESDNGRYGDDHEKALRAVRRGKAVSLKKLKDFLATQYPGKILAINLRKSSGDYFYNVRILGKGNRIKVISLNALTLKPRGN